MMASMSAHMVMKSGTPPIIVPVVSFMGALLFRAFLCRNHYYSQTLAIPIPINSSRILRLPGYDYTAEPYLSYIYNREVDISANFYELNEMIHSFADHYGAHNLPAIAILGAHYLNTESNPYFGIFMAKMFDHYKNAKPLERQVIDKALVNRDQNYLDMGYDKMFPTIDTLMQEILYGQTHVLISSWFDSRLFKNTNNDENRKALHISRTTYFDKPYGWVTHRDCDPYVTKHFRNM
ncbi:unnamed protein product [Oppiella nova]|uniref:Uncharacterized protein n=1 Tax=Oppiella nova TaxID=334625 RepID=A0A7R9QHE6_9ACAR|nr:unnamed protein product [Oppiella nova]CAG2165418.1 unnamed protein product [Oppiella nova]